MLRQQQLQQRYLVALGGFVLETTRLIPAHLDADDTALPSP
jgi:hypothetical protein